MPTNDKPTHEKKYKKRTARAVPEDKKTIDEHVLTILSKLLPTIEKDQSYTLLLTGFIHGTDATRRNVTEHGEDIAEYISKKTGVNHFYNSSIGIVEPV